MKKRLRKKLHKGEFQEFGFYVHFHLPEDVTETELDDFIEQFFAEVIEAQRLDFGGGGGIEWLGFVTPIGPCSLIEKQRKEVASWLENHPKVLQPEVSELRDAWYDTRD